MALSPLIRKISSPFYFVSSLDPPKITHLDFATVKAFEFPATPFNFLKPFSSHDNSTIFHTFNFDSFYANLLDSSTRNAHLTQIHAKLVLLDIHQNGFLITKLINSAVNLGEISYARKVFDEFPDPDVFLWNAIVRGYSKCNMFANAIEMYSRMQVLWVSPDGYTLPHVLKACGGLPGFEMGRRVHGQIFRLGFEKDVFVQNGIVAFYAKCGKIESAKVVFDGLELRNVVSWTSMISGYAQNGQPIEALRVFDEMRKMGVMPDWVAFVSAIRAHTDVEDLEHGKSIHGCVIKMGLELEPDLLIALTAMYAKCGQVMVARSFFDQMKVPNLILWNAMISGYAKNGYAEEAVELFRKMISNNIRTDSITARCAVVACAQVGSLGLARWMDNYISKSEHRDDIFVNSALIDMFAKCGNVDMARMVFDRTLEKDVVVWSAMIVGYGLHGRGREALDLYQLMKQAGVCPNDVTFLGLLTACNHSGLVEDGWRLFHCMKDYGIEPRHQHYACVVDLLGRGGYLDQAYDFIMNMPIEPGVSVWGALLSACKIYRHVTLGEYAAEQLFSIESYNTGHYVQLSNLYASVRMWDRVAKVRVMMKEKGLSKDLGYSLIEINGKLQAFRVGDKSHPQSKEIYEELESLERRLKQAGFIPHTDSSLHDLNYEEMEETLCNHSERLAIAFGLISTAPGTTLRITKNLRACINCHSATKLISKLVNREIVVRDANRFHHFKDGVCSCGDYW
ncbi:Mitochondrial editing factor 22 [Theobroma cacao]|uniref:Mitochondrial editing factor 22 n=1 Tax=Theobroma cacao TaxID=3641 RepID=A0A061EHU3_THECC|nr:Mitochondrial editing factor 22 [Theobroma cacao]